MSAVPFTDGELGRQTKLNALGPENSKCKTLNELIIEFIQQL